MTYAGSAAALAHRRGPVEAEVEVAGRRRRATLQTEGAGKHRRLGFLTIFVIFS